MTTKVDKTYWIEFIAMLFAFIGMLAAVARPLFVLSTQVGFSGSSIWPLPALVLIDWMLIGILSFLGAYLGIKTQRTNWPKLVWFLVGMLLPLLYLGIIGALSIGPVVLISLIFFLASALLITLKKALRWYESLGLLMLGAVWNLGLLWVLIINLTPEF